MISIDYSDKSPIYEQVLRKMENLIVNGVLPPDDKMPSVRNLAIELSINPNTIQRAYGELERKGYIYTVKGRGNFVCSSDKWRSTKVEELEKQLIQVLRELKNVNVDGDHIKKIVDECLGGKNNDKNQ